MGTSSSSVRLRASVGTRIDDSVPDTSISLFISDIALIAPGLALLCTHRRHHRLVAGSPAVVGANPRSSASHHSSVPRTPSPLWRKARHSSRVAAHGKSRVRNHDTGVLYRTRAAVRSG